MTRPTDEALPIVVTGATGGCGATTIAFHLARALARVSKVCLLEASALAGAAERLGLTRARVLTWADGDDFDLAALPVPGGFRAAFAPAEAVARVEIVERALRSFEVVVVDAPRATGAYPGLECARVAVVATTRPAAARVGSLLALPARRRAVVVNRIASRSEPGRATIEAILGRRAALELPPSRSLCDAEDRGALVDGRTRWARGVDALARALLQETAQ